MRKVHDTEIDDFIEEGGDLNEPALQKKFKRIFKSFECEPNVFDIMMSQEKRKEFMNKFSRWSGGQSGTSEFGIYKCVFYFRGMVVKIGKFEDELFTD